MPGWQLLRIMIMGFLITLVDSTEDTLDVSQLVFNGTEYYKLADAGNTNHPILLSSDTAYSWQFFPYNNNTQRLLVVLSTLFNTTVVWIANRDQPVSPNASLRLEFPARSLALRESNGALVWTPGLPVTNISTIVMNATGNLHIVGAGGASSTNSWQSFDEPTDVFVPGQRLLTHHTSTASLSWNNWSSGHYTLSANPGGAVLYATFDAQQNMLPYQIFNYVTTNLSSLAVSLHSACNHTTVTYNQNATGVTLEQEGTISPQCLQEVGINTIHGFSFTYRIGGEGYRFLRVTPIGDIATFFLSNSGLQVENELFKMFYGTYCNLPSYCGINSLCGSVQDCTCPQLFEAIDPSDSTQGCRLVTPLNCSIFRQHQFLEIAGAGYYANANSEPRKHVANPADCTALCLENCSCTAAFYNNETGACYLYDQLRTMKSGASPQITAFLRVASLPATEQAGGKDSIERKVIIGVSVTIAAAVVIMAGLVGWMCRRRPLHEDSDSEEEAFLEALPGLPPRFTYKELQDATEGFSKRLGAGGSGTVYEGNLHLSSAAVRADRHEGDNGDQKQEQIVKVAVKELTMSKYSSIAAASKRHFRAEVATLGNLSHVNLVQLKGFCAEGMHRLLIYEFAEKGSLDNWIFSNAAANSYVLPCEVRYKIAVDMARGLAFLHEECRDKVMHLDVKPQNVLLDKEFRAKLADFGLSKLMERGHSETVTAMRGTPGYMAPEWFLNLPITDRSDVFSFGMVLLELVGGRKNVDAAAPTSEEQYFPAWALKQAERGRIWEAVDKRLQLANQLHGQECAEAAEVDEISGALRKMERLLKVAFWCIQEDASCRPSMTTVVLMLDEHLQVPDPPLDTTHIRRRRQHQIDTSSASATNTTSSTVTTSVLSPR